MATANDIQWSEEVFSLQKLIKLPEKSFPLIVLVTSGYYGQEDMDTLATNQMARFHSFVKQKRVLAKDVKGRYLSIPAKYPIKFQLFDEKAKSNKSYTLEKLMENYKFPLLVQFEKKTKWRFRVGSMKYSTSNFGLIELQSSYEAAFLKGNTIHNGVIDPKVILVPVYVEASVKIARGLKTGTAIEWRDMKAMYSRAVSTVDFNVIYGTKDIMLYPNGVKDPKKAVGESYPIYFTSGSSTITNVSSRSFESESSLFRMNRNANLVLNIDKEKIIHRGRPPPRRGHSLNRISENERARRRVYMRQADGYLSDGEAAMERRSRPVQRMVVGDTITQNVVNVTLPGDDGTIKNGTHGKQAVVPARQLRGQPYHENDVPYRTHSEVATMRSNDYSYPIRRASSLESIDGLYPGRRRYIPNEVRNTTSMPRAIRSRSFRQAPDDTRMAHSEKDLRYLGYDYGMPSNYQNGYVYDHPHKAVSFAPPLASPASSINQLYMGDGSPHSPVIYDQPTRQPAHEPLVTVYKNHLPDQVVNQVHQHDIHQNHFVHPAPFVAHPAPHVAHPISQDPPYQIIHSPPLLQNGGPFSPNIHSPRSPIVPQAPVTVLRSPERTRRIFATELPPPPAYPAVVQGRSPLYPAVVHAAPALPADRAQGSHTKMLTSSSNSQVQYAVDSTYNQDSIGPTYYTVSSTSNPELMRPTYYTSAQTQQPNVYTAHSHQSGENIYSTIPLPDDASDLQITLSQPDLSKSAAYIRRPGLDRGARVAFATSTGQPVMIGSKVVRTNSFNVQETRQQPYETSTLPPRLVRPVENGNVPEGYERATQTLQMTRTFAQPQSHSHDGAPVQTGHQQHQEQVTKQESSRFINSQSNEKIVYQGTLTVPVTNGSQEVESHVERVDIDYTDGVDKVHDEVAATNGLSSRETANDVINTDATSNDVTSKAVTTNGVTTQEKTTEEVTTNGYTESHEYHTEVGRTKLREFPGSYPRYEVPIKYESGLTSSNWMLGSRTVISNPEFTRADKIKHNHGGYREEIKHTGYIRYAPRAAVLSKQYRSDNQRYNTTTPYISGTSHLTSYTDSSSNVKTVSGEDHTVTQTSSSAHMNGNKVPEIHVQSASNSSVHMDAASVASAASDVPDNQVQSAEVENDDAGSGIYSVVNKPSLNRTSNTATHTTTVHTVESSKAAAQDDDASSSTSTSSMTTESSHNQRLTESSYSPNLLTHEVLVHDNTEYRQYTYNYSANDAADDNNNVTERTSGLSVGNDNHKIFVRKEEQVANVVSGESRERTNSMNSLREVMRSAGNTPSGTPKSSTRRRLHMAPATGDQEFSEVLNTTDTRSTQHGSTRMSETVSESKTVTYHNGMTSNQIEFPHDNSGEIEEPMLERVRNSILELDAYLKTQGDADSRSQSSYGAKAYDQFGRLSLTNEITTL